MKDLDDAIAENTAFDLLEIRQAKRAKEKQRDSVQVGTIGSADTRTPIGAS